MTDIQVRSVDDDLARAAKQRAAATHRSLSAYVRDLIAADLEQSDDRLAMRRLLQEIADGGPVADRTATASALADVRREMAGE